MNRRVEHARSAPPSSGAILARTGADRTVLAVATGGGATPRLSGSLPHELAIRRFDVRLIPADQSLYCLQLVEKDIVPRGLLKVAQGLFANATRDFSYFLGGFDTVTGQPVAAISVPNTNRTLPDFICLVLDPTGRFAAFRELQEDRSLVLELASGRLVKTGLPPICALGPDALWYVTTDRSERGSCCAGLTTRRGRWPWASTGAVTCTQSSGRRSDGDHNHRPESCALGTSSPVIWRAAGRACAYSMLSSR